MGGVFGALFGGHRRPGGRAPAAQHRGLAPQPSAAYDGGRRRAVISKKYSYIPDTFTSLDQVPIHLLAASSLARFLFENSVQKKS